MKCRKIVSFLVALVFVFTSMSPALPVFAAGEDIQVEYVTENFADANLWNRWTIDGKYNVVDNQINFAHSNEPGSEYNNAITATFTLPRAVPLEKNLGTVNFDFSLFSKLTKSLGGGDLARKKSLAFLDSVGNTLFEVFAGTDSGGWIFCKAGNYQIANNSIKRTTDNAFPIFDMGETIDFRFAIDTDQKNFKLYLKEEKIGSGGAADSDYVLQKNAYNAVLESFTFLNDTAKDIAAIQFKMEGISGASNDQMSLSKFKYPKVTDPNAPKVSYETENFQGPTLTEDWDTSVANPSNVKPGTGVILADNKLNFIHSNGENAYNGEISATYNLPQAIPFQKDVGKVSFEFSMFSKLIGNKPDDAPAGYLSRTKEVSFLDASGNKIFAISEARDQGWIWCQSGNYTNTFKRTPYSGTGNAYPKFDPDETINFRVKFNMEAKTISIDAKEENASAAGGEGKSDESYVPLSGSTTVFEPLFDSCTEIAAVKFRMEGFSGASNDQMSVSNFTYPVVELPDAPVVPDTEAPAWPAQAELTASELTCTSVNLSWPAAADDVAVTGYNVYQGETLLQDVKTQTAYSLTGLTPGTEYALSVKAYDAAGNESAALSKTVSTLPETAVPGELEYLYRDDYGYLEMTYDGTKWSGGGAEISGAAMTPADNADAVWAWRSDRTGTVSLSGKPVLSGGTADVIIKKNTEVLWSGSDLAAGAEINPPLSEIAVTPFDAVYVIAAKKSGAPVLTWEPEIIVTGENPKKTVTITPIPEAVGAPPYTPTSEEPFHEDFSGTAAGWDGSSAWQVQDGKYVYTAPDANSAYSKYKDSAAWENYEYSALVQAPALAGTGDQTSAYSGISFRDTARLDFGMTGGGKNHDQVEIWSGINLIKSWTFTYEPGKVYKMTVKAVGNEFTVTVSDPDGTNAYGFNQGGEAVKLESGAVPSVSLISDQVTKTGAVGLYAKTANVQFDDVTVNHLPPSDYQYDDTYGVYTPDDGSAIVVEETKANGVGVAIDRTAKDYKGTGYVTGFDQEGDSLTYAIFSPNSGNRFQFSFRYHADTDGKGTLYLNGEKLAALNFGATGGGWQSLTLVSKDNPIQGILRYGTNLLTLKLDSGDTGGMDIDSMTYQEMTGYAWDKPKDGTADIEHVSLYSPSMNRQVGFNVYLPPSYNADPSNRYPVIYNLHSLGSSARAYWTMIDNYRIALANGTAKEAIWVFVEGRYNTFYNDAYDGSSKSETSIIDEVLPYIDRNYRTISTREGRGAMGFSMGGHGSIKLMSKYPELFSTAATYGGAFHNTETFNIAYPSYFQELFHNDASLMLPEVIAESETHQAEDLLGRNAQRMKELGVNIQMFCGVKDHTYSYNQRLDQRLTNEGIEHGYVAIQDTTYEHDPDKYMKSEYGAQGYKFLSDHLAAPQVVDITPAGTKSVKAVFTGGRTFDNMTQGMTLTPNTDYVASMKMRKLSGNGTIWFKMVLPSSAGTLAAETITPTDDWMQYTFSFNSGSAEKADFYFTDNSFTAVTIEIDDCFIGVDKTSQNLLTNGDFEAGAAGWDFGSKGIFTLYEQAAPTGHTVTVQTDAGADSVELLQDSAVKYSAKAVNNQAVISAVEDGVYQLRVICKEGYEPVSGNQDTVTVSGAEQTASVQTRAKTYAVSVTQPAHGSITAPENADFGQTVPVSVTPEQGYEVKRVYYYKTDGGSVDSASAITGGSFTMPAYAVTVGAELAEAAQSDIEYRTETFDVMPSEGWSMTGDVKAEAGKLKLSGAGNTSAQYTLHNPVILGENSPGIVEFETTITSGQNSTTAEPGRKEKTVDFLDQSGNSVMQFQIAADGWLFFQAGADAMHGLKVGSKDQAAVKDQDVSIKLQINTADKTVSLWVKNGTDEYSMPTYYLASDGRSDHKFENMPLGTSAEIASVKYWFWGNELKTVNTMTVDNFRYPYLYSEDDVILPHRTEEFNAVPSEGWSMAGDVKAEAGKLVLEGQGETAAAYTLTQPLVLGADGQGTVEFEAALSTGQINSTDQDDGTKDKEFWLTNAKGEKIVSISITPSGYLMYNDSTSSRTMKINFQDQKTEAGQEAKVKLAVNIKKKTLTVMLDNGSGNYSIPTYYSSADQLSDHLYQNMPLPEGVTEIAGAKFFFYGNGKGMANKLTVDHFRYPYVELPDEEAPAWGGGAALTASNPTATGAALSWPEASDNRGVIGYEIYNGTTLVQTVGAAVRSFNVTGLSPETVYTYSVKAVDEAGNKSEALSCTFTTKAGALDVTSPLTLKQGGEVLGSLAAGTVTAEAMLHNSKTSDESVTVVIASYQNGVLNNIKTETYPCEAGKDQAVKAEITVSRVDANTQVRAFLFDGMDTIRPLSKRVTADQNGVKE